VRLASHLRTEITQGRIGAGEYLPTERQLAEGHGIARMTVRRALKNLENENLIKAEPRHGYRVMAGATDPDRGFPISYILEAEKEAGQWDAFHQLLLGSFQAAAGDRGWSLLGVNAGKRSAAEILEQLRAARVCGVTLDSTNHELIKLVAASGMPAVIVDAWTEESPFDMILQDNYRGAYLAAQHLLKKGHRRIAFVGSIGKTGHSRERYAGAVAALVGAGLELPPSLRCECENGQVSEKAAGLLDGPDAPTGIVVPWRGLSIELAELIREKDLKLGKDIDIVGWAPAEVYGDYCQEIARFGPVPATVLWNVEHMARMAMSRLAERRQDLSLPPVRISVPVRIKTAEETCEIK